MNAMIDFTALLEKVAGRLHIVWSQCSEDVKHCCNERGNYRAPAPDWSLDHNSWLQLLHSNSENVDVK